VKTTSRAWLRDNGTWVPDAAIPVTDRAVRYGMAVFETIGIRGGKPLLLARHLDLLEESARTLLGLGQTPGLDGSLPALTGDDHGMLRLYVTAGDGSATGAVVVPRIFALFEPHDPGTIPGEQTARLHPQPVMPYAHGRKTGNYWMNCSSQAAAQADGFDHALLSDPEGFLLSAAMGNLFLVLDGKLCTPSSSLAIRPGVIREWIVQRHRVDETEFRADKLPEVSELFLTNSRLGVMPLRCGKVSPGPVGRSLREEVLREKIVP